MTLGLQQVVLGDNLRRSLADDLLSILGDATTITIVDFGEQIILLVQTDDHIPLDEFRPLCRLEIPGKRGPQNSPGNPDATRCCYVP